MDNRDRLVDLLLFANETASISGRELDTDEVNDFADFLDINDVVVQRWISVEERLPEEEQRVVFIPTCNHKSIYVGVLANVGKSGGVMFSHREGRYRSNYYAKYWMPLPEMPKEE